MTKLIRTDTMMIVAKRLSTAICLPTITAIACGQVRTSGRLSLRSGSSARYGNTGTDTEANVVGLIMSWVQPRNRARDSEELLQTLNVGRTPLVCRGS